MSSARQPPGGGRTPAAASIPPEEFFKPAQVPPPPTPPPGLEARDFSKPIEEQTSAFANPQVGQVIGHDDLVKMSEKRIATEGVPENYRDPRTGFKEREEKEREAQAPRRHNVPPPPDPEDVIDDDLLAQVERSLGVRPDVLYHSHLSYRGVELDFEFRKPDYDDYFWAAGEVEERVRQQFSADAPALPQSPDFPAGLSRMQTSQLIDNLVACRSVVRMNGKLLVDRFKLVPAVKQLDPRFDGTYEKIPPTFIGVAAVKLYEFMRRIDPEVIGWLTTQLVEIDQGRIKPITAESGVDENPT